MPGIYSDHINIIRAETICARSRHFDAGMLKAAKIQGRASNGRAMLIIHPFFTNSTGMDYFVDEREPYLFRQIMVKDYDAYVDRLGRCLKSAKMLPFVLAGNKLYDKVSCWLNDLGLDKNVFIQNTVKDNDPTPGFGFSDRSFSWRTLAEILQKMDIFKVFLAGELAYLEKTEKTGCVYNVQRELWPFFPGRVQVLRYLTFPGLYEPLPYPRHPVLAGHHQDIR